MSWRGRASRNCILKLQSIAYHASNKSYVRVASCNQKERMFVKEYLAAAAAAKAASEHSLCVRNGSLVHSSSIGTIGQELLKLLLVLSDAAAVVAVWSSGEIRVDRHRPDVAAFVKLTFIGSS